jgi:hypothetical protein
MPTTTAEHKRSLVTPGIYALLPIRDFLPGALTPADGVMVRTDGCYVAGFHLGGSAQATARLEVLVEEKCMPLPVEVEAVAACRPGRCIRALLPDRAAGECLPRTLLHLLFKGAQHKPGFEHITEDSDEWLLLL